MEKGVLDINKNSLFVVAIYLGLVLFPPLVPDDLEFFKKFLSGYAILSLSVKMP